MSLHDHAPRATPCARTGRAASPPLGRAFLLAATLLAAASWDQARAQATKAGQPPAAATGGGMLDATNAVAGVRVAVDVRPALVVKGPEVRRALMALPQVEMQSEVKAFLAGEIEQVLLFVAERPAGAPRDAGPPPVTILLRSPGPYDWKKFISSRVEEVKKAGVNYLRAGAPEARGLTCYRVLDERTLMMGAEDEILAPPLGPNRPKGKHAWDDAWRKLRPGTVRIGIDTRWVDEQVQESRKGDPAPLPPTVAPLIAKTQAFALTLDSATRLNLDLLATSASDDDAAQVVRAIRGLLATGRTLMPNLRQATANVPPAGRQQVDSLLTSLDAVLATARVEQALASTRLHAETDTPTFALATALLLPAVQAAREAARRTQSSNNLKRMGIALHNYYTDHDSFPPPVLTGPGGKAKYSWRVALLPYLDQQSLYKEYNRDEPWDGPTNRKLVGRMPEIYHDPSYADAQALSYFALVGPDTVLANRAAGTKIAEVPDGTASTIAIVEAQRDIPWTKPEDILVAAGVEATKLGGAHPGGSLVLFADGSVRFLKRTIESATLHALTTRAGGEIIAPGAF